MIGNHDNADQTSNNNDNTNRRHNQQQGKLQKQFHVKNFNHNLLIKRIIMTSYEEPPKQVRKKVLQDINFICVVSRYVLASQRF